MATQKMTETSIGIEIEINRFNNRILSALDKTLWKTQDEHCGSELKSVPCRGPVEIRRIIKSIEAFDKADPLKSCGFNNAGVHIHIDFIPPPQQDNPRKAEDLTLIDSSKPEKFWCEECNRHHEDDPQLPFGKKFKIYYSHEKTGSYFKTPDDYIRAWRPKKPNPGKVYIDKTNHRTLLEDVKRFMTIGVRFAPLLFALQQPERRLNKYCHTIQYWDEALLSKCKSISDICEHPALLNKHRRHMLNPMAFSKFGTMEVRMIAGTLDPKEIWTQIYLFGKLARLAKSRDEIPESTNHVASDFVNLMSAARIHGKMRRRLAGMIKDRQANIVLCRCFVCYEAGDSPTYTHMGLSRTICSPCMGKLMFCDYCGNRYNHDDNVMTITGRKGKKRGRLKCSYCSESKIGTKTDIERIFKCTYIMGKPIQNSGIDEEGYPTRGGVF
jgi:hypothetical protein